ncbi:DUF998 domain-containing protein [Nocardioidaceae bacterium]|nr:DUF998 domain-containing protein [Nocardioidaceae bacterium]
MTAGATEPGYRPAQQYLSELAARDSGVAPWAIGAFLASATAHAAGAVALWRARARAAAAALGAAALAVIGIAGFRLSGSGAGDVLDTLHAASVVAYQVAWVLAVVAWGRARTATPLAVALAVAVVVAVTSTVLLVLSLGDSTGVPGVLQRCWVVVDQAWLLVATLIATRLATRLATRVTQGSRPPAGPAR